MQLRVARLCLDCEELYVGSACPICASEHYIFLSSWVPVEERRKWRKPQSRADRGKPGPVQVVKEAFHRWFGDEDTPPTGRILRTRASDHVPDLSFDKPAPEAEAKAKPAAPPEPAKASSRRT